jgi:hypothetical protein
MHEITFKNGEATAIGDRDVQEYRFMDEDTVLVQPELYDAMLSNYQFRNMVADAYDHIQDEGWTGIGVVTNTDGSLFHAGVTIGDYGKNTVGDGHLCQVAKLVANGQAIEEALKEADARDQIAERGYDETGSVTDQAAFDRFAAPGGNAILTRERWFEGSEDVYLFDLGAVHITKTVDDIQGALAHYPLLSDEAYREIEREMAASVFRNALRCIDHDSLDVDQLTESFLSMSDYLCPECGWSVDENDVLSDAGAQECVDCFDQFDPEHDDTSAKRCVGCTDDHADQVQEAKEKCKELFDFNPTNGDGVVICWNDGNYYFWNRTRQQWEIRMKLRDTQVLNERGQ